MNWPNVGKILVVNYFSCVRTLQLIWNASPKVIIYACCQSKRKGKRAMEFYLRLNPNMYGILEQMWCSLLILVYHICNTIPFKNWLKYIIHLSKYLLFGFWRFSDFSLPLFASAIFINGVFVTLKMNSTNLVSNNAG